MGNEENFNADLQGATLAAAMAGVLALQLHRKGGLELTIDLPAGACPDVSGLAGVKVYDGALRFASLADRNRLVANNELAALGPRLRDADVLFDAAYALWRHEIGHADTASGRLLAAAARQIDILTLAAARMTSGHATFDVLHLVGAMLAHVDALDLAALTALCEAQHPHTANDLAGGVFFNKVQAWLATRPGAAAQLTQSLLPRPGDGSGNLLGAAWMAWFLQEPTAAAELLAAQARRTDAPLPSLTCWISGRFLAEGTLPAQWVAPLEAIILERLDSADPVTRRAGLAAATALLHRRRSFDDPLRRLAARGDLEAAAFIAQALSHETEALLAQDQFARWLPLCAALGPEHKGVLGQLDYVLSLHLAAATPARSVALTFLESWIQARPSDGPKDRGFADLFDMCTAAILSDAGLCSLVVTRWLLADALTLSAATASILSREQRRQMPPLTFDAALLNAAPDADLRFIARRMLGYVIDPQQLLSLALSLFALANAKVRIHPHMAWLLAEEIGYDYPGTTIERLRVHAGQERDADTKALVEVIAQGLEHAMSTLDQLPRLRELRPPVELRRGFVKARGKQMEASMREARAQSVLLPLVTQVHIKGGYSTFQSLEGRFTEPSAMSSISYSFELPRRETLDPVGNAWRLHVLRNAKRSAS